MSDNKECLAIGLLGTDQEGPNSSYEDEYYKLIHTQFVCEFVHEDGCLGAWGVDMVMWQHTDNLGTILELN